METAKFPVQFSLMKSLLDEESPDLTLGTVFQ